MDIRSRSRRPWPAIVFCVAAAVILIARHMEAPVHGRSLPQREIKLSHSP